jgi:hypothetical protein
MRLKLSLVERLLEPRRKPPPAELDLACLARRVDGLLARGYPLVRSGCLTRGVTLYYVLRRLGVDVALAFGVGASDSGFVGHCWLVRGDQPFLEAADPRGRFAEVVRLGEAAAHRPSLG